MSGRIAVTGSIATDHLMEFPGLFTDHLVADQLDTVSLSFLVDGLQIRKGGVAANIAFGLGSLGARPVLVGAVGPDFDEHRRWLDQHNVDTGTLLVSHARHTARFICTTDQAQNQIASFYAGAMTEAREIDLATIVDRRGPVELVVIAPNDPAAMLGYTSFCRDRAIAFVADPSQQLARMPGDEIRRLVDGAAYLVTNRYERSLLLQQTGWRQNELADRVGVWITTHGADGVTIDRAGERSITVPAVPPKAIADPTGVGDAFRAGFLWGRANRLNVERSAQVGCTLATIALETLGSQEYSLDRAGFSDRAARAYGSDAAGEIESKLRV